MFKALFHVIFVVTVAGSQNDPATHQLPDFKNHTTGPIGTITTNAGAPVENKDATTSLNTDLLTNEYLMDEMTSFVHERIPERTVHASGVGAFGYFEATEDWSNITKAALFRKVGKRTPIAVRFSLGPSSIGSPDTVREIRGFAVKFYTEEGNFDLLARNSIVFPVKDPLLVPSLTHRNRRNPETNLPDPNASWDFLTLNPETLFDHLYKSSDYGTPVSYRQMPGHTLHTYQVYNDKGDSSFVRFHFIPDAGEKYFNATGFAKLVAGDYDYYARDLYNAIANGEYPSWSLKVQVLSEDDVKKADYEAFDITKDLPTDQYPLCTVGTLVLNRNPVNYYAEVEHLAFGSGNTCPGILGSPDAIFTIRRFVYREAATHRLGLNFKKIPVNAPTNLYNYNRDGVPPVNGNGKDAPNYYPNSFNGPTPYVDNNKPALLSIVEKPANNFKRANNFYINVLTAAQRNSTINVIVKSLCPCEDFIKQRAIKAFSNINSDLANGITNGLKVNCVSSLTRTSDTLGS